MKIAVFGGTFDPVHNGHIALAETVLARRYADRVLFVPAPVPPHKADRPITPFAIRFRMLEAALEGRNRFSLSDLENRRPGRSYTIDTLKQLSQFHQNDDILLLIGGDSLRQLHLWKDAHEIVRRFGVIAYPRGDHAVSRAELLVHWTEEETEKLLASVLPSLPVFPVSSTEIRTMIRCGEWSGASGLLPAPVLDFIRRNKIYCKTTQEGDNDGN